MRELTDADRVERFMTALAGAARSPADVFLTGGSTAVLLGWRGATVDVDLKRGDQRLLELLAAIEPELYRFPAVDPRALRRRVEELVATPPEGLS